MNEHLKELIEQARATGRTYDYNEIERAFGIANDAHRGQVRKSGEPYFSHPVNVASILIDFGMDTDSIVAGLLHDVVEDTEFTFDDIATKFGITIAELVDGVTKLGKIPFSTDEEQQAENVRKMFLAMSKDIRVIIIKLADRLHNMRTLEFMLAQKQRDKAKETMEVYAPIAHRLGMRTVKEELEDLSLRYLDPIAYEEIERALEKRQMIKGDFLEQIKANITIRVKNISKNFGIESRVKSIYGIYRKIYMPGKSFDEIYDIYAIRIIVDTVEECYNVLGVVHEMYRLIPNRFKDYISTPKKNMYQSLHTTVIGKEGIPLEIQIRTWDMHRTAEYGIAAHWKYKVAVDVGDKLDERLGWIRNVIKSQQDTSDAEDIIGTIKTDLSQEDIFVMTPKGDVIALPVGSTVVDFAYSIHTAVGNKMIGAKVDGRIVPLDYQLKTGEITEIITTKSQSHGPSRDWLKIVKTSEARGKIRSWFKKERRDENIVEGKAELEREFRRNNMKFEDEQLKQLISGISKRNNYNSVEDFYAAIGYGGVRLLHVFPRIKDEYQKLMRQKDPIDPNDLVTNKKPSKVSGGVIVEGLDNCLCKFAKCCNPIPGENIVGFITRGYGVSIHKSDCVHSLSGMADELERERWVSAKWAENTKNTEIYKATLSILAINRNELYADISTTLSSMHIPIYSINARLNREKNSEIIVTVGITTIEQLKSLTAKIGRVNGILSVDRTGV